MGIFRLRLRFGSWFILVQIEVRPSVLAGHFGGVCSSVFAEFSGDGDGVLNLELAEPAIEVDAFIGRLHDDEDCAAEQFLVLRRGLSIVRCADLKVDALRNRRRMSERGTTWSVGRPDLWQFGFGDRLTTAAIFSVASIAAVEIGFDRVSATNGSTDSVSVGVEFDVVIITPEVDVAAVLEGQRVVEDIEVTLVTEREQVFERYARALVAGFEIGL